MNLKQLEYIVTINREGGIKKAAEKLFITQPALSQQLIRVEEELGIRIFERGKGAQFTPTYEGQHYLEIAERILYEQDQARIWIEEAHNMLHGRLSIGISQPRCRQVMPLLLPEFKRRYPQIQIEIHEEPMFKAKAMIMSGEIDLALMISEYFSDGLTFDPLFRERFFLAVPPDSDVDRRCQQHVETSGQVRIEDLANEDYILLHHGGYLRKLVDDMFERKRITPNIILETVDSDLALSLCAADCGLTFASEMSTLFSGISPRPSYYSMEHELESWWLGIAYHPEHYQTKVMRTFLSFAREELTGHIAAARVL